MIILSLLYAIFGVLTSFGMMVAMRRYPHKLMPADKDEYWPIVISCTIFWPLIWLWILIQIPFLLIQKLYFGLDALADRITP